MRCLEKDPARRYGNAAELASALEPFAPPEASAAVERARLIATGMHPVDVSGPLDVVAGSFGRQLSQRASTPRSTTQDVAEELHRVRKRRYAGVAVGVASVALVLGLAVPLVVVYLEPEEPRVTPDATTTLQSARVTSTVESDPTTLETAETTTGSLVPPSPFAPPPEPAEAGSALPGGALTDAKRQATTTRGRPGPPSRAPADADTPADPYTPVGADADADADAAAPADVAPPEPAPTATPPPPPPPSPAPTPQPQPQGPHDDIPSMR